MAKKRGKEAAEEEVETAKTLSYLSYLPVYDFDKARELNLKFTCPSDGRVEIKRQCINEVIYGIEESSDF